MLIRGLSVVNQPLPNTKVNGYMYLQGKHVYCFASLVSSDQVLKGEYTPLGASSVL